jgi:tetratricopeptide (TPR) repeat protein
LAAASFKPSSKSVQALRYYNEGSELARQGKQLEAVKKFQASTEEDPNFGLAFSKLGQAYAALGHTSDADKLSMKAVSLSDALPPQEKYLILATRARILHDNRKAIEYYESLDKAMPGSEDVAFALANLYEDTGAYDKARVRFAELLERDPKYIDALLGAGRVEIRSGKANDALDYFNRALSVAIQRQNDEARAGVLRMLGLNYRVLGKPQDAFRYYEESLEI